MEKIMKYWVPLLCVWLLTITLAHAQSVFIEDLTWPEIQQAIDTGSTTAIYYAGSTEQNGTHMATGKHNFIARYVAERIARKIGNALVYPIMPFAPTGDPETRTEHMQFPGSVSISEISFSAVARDVALSARAGGFKFILLMGDHGGGQDALKKLAESLNRQWNSDGIHVFHIAALYYQSEQQERAYLIKRGLPAGGHAGIADTSALMFIDKNRKWVRRDKLASAGGKNGADGDPRRASGQLGKTFLDFKIDSAVAQIVSLISR